MRLSRGLVLGCALGATLAAAAALVPARAGTPDEHRLGPGCDPARRATAHHAGGVVLSPQPLGGPVACTISTGFPGAESFLFEAAGGAEIYTPAVVPAGTFGTGEGPA